MVFSFFEILVVLPPFLVVCWMFYTGFIKSDADEEHDRSDTYPETADTHDDTGKLKAPGKVN
jgi:hypothetical protein